MQTRKPSRAGAPHSAGLAYDKAAAGDRAAWGFIKDLVAVAAERQAALAKAPALDPVKMAERRAALARKMAASPWERPKRQPPR